MYYRENIYIYILQLFL